MTVTLNKLNMIYLIIGSILLLVTLSATAQNIESKKLSRFQQAYADAIAQGSNQFSFTNKAGETKIYAIDPQNIESKKLSRFQQAYADAIAQGSNQFSFTNKAGETKIYAIGVQNTEPASEEIAVVPAIDFIKTGFTQAEDQQNQTGGLRDPFAEPQSSRAMTRQSNGKAEDVDAQEQSYHLSGVLVAPKQQFCVIISPLGESNVYTVGDTFTKKRKKITILAIKMSYIITNASAKRIKVGDEIN